jgi:hypothetical protein
VADAKKAAGAASNDRDNNARALKSAEAALKEAKATAVAAEKANKAAQRELEAQVKSANESVKDMQNQLVRDDVAPPCVAVR